MESRLIPINAWIALHRGESGWPAKMADQGFRVHRLEAPIRTSAGQVVVDGISVSDANNSVVPTECKSGQNVETEQARRYAAMTSTDVARLVGLPFDAVSAQIGPAYACLEESRAGIVVDLDRLGLPFAVLAVGDRRVTLEARGNSVLQPFDVAVPSGTPPRYIVLDPDSPEDEFVEYLMPELVAGASRGEEYVALEALVGAVVPYWDVFGAPAKRRLLEKARNALARTFARQFRNDFAFEPTGAMGTGAVIRVISSPAGFDPRGRTQSWQRLQRQTASSLGRTPPRARPVPGQRVLFEDLGLGIDQRD